MTGELFRDDAMLRECPATGIERLGWADAQA